MDKAVTSADKALKPPRTRYETLLQEIRDWPEGVKYIVLRLRGASDGLASELTGLSLHVLQQHRKGLFGKVEQELLGGDYQEDARSAADADVILQADMLLTQIVTTGLKEWGTFGKEDRGHVMEAIKLLKKDGAGKKEGPESYEDAIHRMRKKTKGKE